MASFGVSETAETRSIANGSERDDYVSRRTGAPKEISPSAEGDEGYAPSTAPAFLLRKAGQKNLSLGFIYNFLC
ncbi:MAG: hypothetical protein ACI4RV_06890 [Eubacteriales bacterium]